MIPIPPANDPQDGAWIRKIHACLGGELLPTLEALIDAATTPADPPFDPEERARFRAFALAYFRHLDRSEPGDEMASALERTWHQYGGAGLSLDWVHRAFNAYLAAMTRAALTRLPAPAEERAQAALALQQAVLAKLAAVARAVHVPAAAARAIGEEALADRVDYPAFLERLRFEVDGKGTEATLVAVLVAEIDTIREVDSVMGYASGDRLAEALLERLRRALRTRDVVGRIGRSDMGFILPGVLHEGTATLAANKILRVLAEPFQMEARQVAVDARVGITLGTRGSVTAEEALRQACIAAREARRNHVGYTAHAELDALAGDSPLILRTDLREAIEENEIFLCFQPQVDLRTGRVAGAEALLRWVHSKRGQVPPNVFVRIAEHGGLISSLTTWVVNAAARHCASLVGAGLDVRMAVNVSAYDLLDTDFADFTAHALELWGVPPERLVVEVTETAVMEDQQRAFEMLVRLKQLGVRVSMDDFGTGYSSMARLRHLPIDELKIDLSFVKAVLDGDKDKKIVKSMIDLGHGLDMEVVAEGVENQDTLGCLAELGIDLAQGYLISKPLPFADFERFVRAFDPGQLAVRRSKESR
ncbi:MAG: GGDEF domain-containing phosphodiesterase [Pseudomonadota bacterium]